MSNARFSRIVYIHTSTLREKCCEFSLDIVVKLKVTASLRACEALRCCDKVTIFSF